MDGKQNKQKSTTIAANSVTETIANLLHSPSIPWKKKELGKIPKLN